MATEALTLQASEPRVSLDATAAPRRGRFRREDGEDGPRSHGGGRIKHGLEDVAGHINAYK